MAELGLLLCKLISAAVVYAVPVSPVLIPLHSFSLGRELALSLEGGWVSALHLVLVSLCKIPLTDSARGGAGKPAEGRIRRGGGMEKMRERI